MTRPTCRIMQNNVITKNSESPSYVALTVLMFYDVDTEALACIHSFHSATLCYNRLFVTSPYFKLDCRSFNKRRFSVVRSPCALSADTTEQYAVSSRCRKAFLYSNSDIIDSLHQLDTASTHHQQHPIRMGTLIYCAYQHSFFHYYVLTCLAYGNASIIRGFSNPILTVTWLGFYCVNASNGLFNVK